MLTLNNISKSYKNIQANDNLSLKLETGTINILLGPNGAGKSTLIKSVCGLVKPDNGNIEINGYNNRSNKAKELFFLPS